MSRVRTKQMVKFVEYSNKYLRDHKIKDDRSEVFWFICTYLRDHNAYRGYNFFKDQVMHDGITRPALAGSYDKDKFDYLQVY